MATYEQFQQQSSSNKTGLAKVNAAKRLLGWTLDSGAIYSIPFDASPVIVKITDAGSLLTSVASKGAITSATYFLDRSTKTLFLETSGGDPPNDSFIACTFTLFFATEPVNAPFDLSAGFEVSWLPLLNPVSRFGVKLNSADQTGQALEGSGSISFKNEQGYFKSRYDKLFFENKLCQIFSWSKDLDITEAKLIYKGRIVTKSYSEENVSFGLRDIVHQLRVSPPLAKIGDLPGVRVPDGLREAFQRRIYGYKFGFRTTNIDQSLDAFPLVGTLAISTGSTTLTGTGTAFLTDLSPGDDIIIDGIEDAVTVESIQSDTSLTLSADFDENTLTVSTFSVNPELSKRYINRIHFVSGDTLAEPSTTVSTTEGLTIFNVVSAAGFREGDPIIVNGEERTILRLSGLTVRVSVAFSSTPTGSVVRPSFANIRINNTLLFRDRDYTVPASNDRIVLTTTAERNVARLKTLFPGTISMTSASRAVTGTGTNFLTLLPGDWIRVKGASTNTFHEILQVISETSLDLRVGSDTTASGSADLKNPNVYTEDEDVLTCDVIGKTDDGTKSGNFAITASDIVRDILRSVVVADFDINETSFAEANELVESRLGLAIPNTFNSKSIPKSRDLINLVNQSVFGALVQNEDHKFEYKVLAPGRVLEDLKIDETQTLSFSVQSKSDRIIKTAFINYDKKEYDPLTAGESFSSVSSTSDVASFLAETENTVTKETLLIDLRDAKVIAQRLRFIREVSSSVVKLKTKLQTARLQVTDIIQFTNPKLYERFGSQDNIKVAAIQSLKKSATDVEIELDDLGNSFSRAFTITENTAPDFGAASQDQMLVNGYITDNSGLIDNDPETEGLYLIF